MLLLEFLLNWPTACVYTQTPGVLSHTQCRYSCEGIEKICWEEPCTPLIITRPWQTPTEMERDNGTLNRSYNKFSAYNTAFSRHLITLLLKHWFKCNYSLLSIQQHNVNINRFCFLRRHVCNKWKSWFVIQSWHPAFDKRGNQQQRKLNNKQKNNKIKK